MTPEQIEQLAANWTAAQRTVAAFVRTLVTDFHEAEEVLQCVAVTLVRKYGQYDTARPFVPWAIGFAKLEALRHLRQKRTGRLVFDDALVERIAEGFTRAEPEPAPVTRFLDECVEELDGRARRAIELRYQSNLRTAQIAVELEISDGAARMLLSRARTLLRKCVEARAARRKDDS